MTVTTIGPRHATRPALDARRELRAQIAALERELSDAHARLRTRLVTDHAPRPPRMLSAAELESVRDELSGRLIESYLALAREAARHAEHRALLNRMYVDPTGHRWTTITTRDLGEPGCRQWQSRPVLGVIGLLSGWWRVRVSSGCP